VRLCLSNPGKCRLLQYVYIKRSVVYFLCTVEITVELLFSSGGGSLFIPGSRVEESSSSIRIIIIFSNPFQFWFHNLAILIRHSTLNLHRSFGSKWKVRNRHQKPGGGGGSQRAAELRALDRVTPYVSRTGTTSNLNVFRRKCDLLVGKDTNRKAEASKSKMTAVSFDDPPIRSAPRGVTQDFYL
jgi:hypothetical protein